jgi:DNA segregation ATPase FtsK/SpoIIIE-like protein
MDPPSNNNGDELKRCDRIRIVFNWIRSPAAISVTVYHYVMICAKFVLQQQGKCIFQFTFSFFYSELLFYYQGLYILRYMLRPRSMPIPGLAGEADELFKNAVEIIVPYDRSSPSLLQRRLSIGYARAVRLLDQLEAAGVVGPSEGSKPREVLILSLDELFGTANNGKKPSNQEDPFRVP